MVQEQGFGTFKSGMKEKMEADTGEQPVEADWHILSGECGGLSIEDLKKCNLDIKRTTLLLIENL